MKWLASDIDLYVKAAGYVDTAVIPLIPLSWGAQRKHTVLKGEYPILISNELERQLKGRVILFPAFTYLESETEKEVVARIQALSEELTHNGLPYLVFITSDAQWSGVGSLQDQLVTIPPVPLEHMEEEYQRETVSEHVKHILQIVTIKWQSPIQGE